MRLSDCREFSFDVYPAIDGYVGVIDFIDGDGKFALEVNGKTFLEALKKLSEILPDEFYDIDTGTFAAGNGPKPSTSLNSGEPSNGA